MPANIAAIASAIVTVWRAKPIVRRIPARVCEVDGVVVGVGVSVCADAWVCDFPPVWLDEQAEFRGVVAGVEVLQPDAGKRDNESGIYGCRCVDVEALCGCVACAFSVAGALKPSCGLGLVPR